MPVPKVATLDLIGESGYLTKPQVCRVLLVLKLNDKQYWSCKGTCEYYTTLVYFTI